MLADLKRYPAMKDSGVQWLAEVPEHWEVRRLKHVCSLRSGEGITAEAIEPQGEFPVYGGNGWRGFTSAFTHDGEFPLIGRQGALCGNVHLASGRFWASEHAVVASPARECDSKWLAHALRVMDLRQHSIAAAQPGLAVERILTLPICLPPLPEQAAIVRFLDHADRRIRRYIRAKQKLIKLLEEQKQAIIHSAVTRGLDPSVRLKPSGVEWLGDVPAHWEVLMLGRRLNRIEQGWSPVAAEGELATDQWAVLTLSSVRRGTFDPGAIKPVPVSARIPSDIEIKDGDLLLTRSNTRELVGDTCIVRVSRPKTLMCDLIYRLTPDATRFNAVFLMYQLLSYVGRRQIESDARGSSGTMPKIGQRHIRSWRVTCPPLDEQRTVVESIENDLGTINAAAQRAEIEISLLREYRTRLIADVVTGKLDVREAAARLPDEVAGEEVAELQDDVLDDEGATAEELAGELEEVEV